MRLENIVIFVFISSITAVCVCTILQMIARYEKRKDMSRMEKILLMGMIFLTIYFLWSFSPRNVVANTCSMAILLIIAVVDGQTGYVYNIFGYYVLITAAIQALCRWPCLTRYELQLLAMYLLVICISAAVKGLGLGDVPVLFALMFYYLSYSDFPASATLFMFLLSQILFAIGLLINRTKQSPLIPYVWISHVITMCIWC